MLVNVVIDPTPGLLLQLEVAALSDAIQDLKARLKANGPDPTGVETIRDLTEVTRQYLNPFTA